MRQPAAKERATTPAAHVSCGLGTTLLHVEVILRRMAPQDLLAEALKLSTEERARLVRALIKSLDDGGEDPADVERAWATEIERRARRAIRGVSAGKDWDAAIRKIESKHRRK
jgi:putative addiction module component (TIGR02574 family)